MRGNANPATLAPCIGVGVAAQPHLPVRFPVLESGMDECDLTEEPDTHVDGLGIRALIGPGHPPQELRAVDDRAVGIAAEKVLGQVLGIPAHIRLLGGAQVVAIEVFQDLPILCPGAVLLECGVLHDDGLLDWLAVARILVAALAYKKSQILCILWCQTILPGRVHASEPARRERPPVPPHLWRTQVRHPRGQIWSGCTPAIDAGACRRSRSLQEYGHAGLRATPGRRLCRQPGPLDYPGCRRRDRKSTRLNSSHT